MPKGRFTLERLLEYKGSTIGRLSGPGLECLTIERPWRDNRPSVSCIPEGFYFLDPHSSEKHPDTWALVGSTVSHFPSLCERSAVLFHSANYASELQGCIAPGLSVDLSAGILRIRDSRPAMEKIRAAIRKDEPVFLTITRQGG